MDPDFQIVTPRLYLRPIVATDAADIFAMDSDPEVHTYLGKQPVTDIAQIHEVISFIQQQYADNGIARWAMVLRESGRCIGWAGLKLRRESLHGHENYHDLGYRLHRDFWGLGYATEAGEASLQYGFDTLGLTHIYAMAELGNAGSRRVLSKLGFTEDGSLEFEGATNVWLSLPAAHWRARQTK